MPARLIDEVITVELMRGDCVKKLGVCLLLFILLQTGCQPDQSAEHLSKEPIAEDAKQPDRASDVVFPDHIKLSYQKVDFERLENDTAIITGLEKQKSISFGEISGESIVIDLYTGKKEETEYVVGGLQFKNETRMIQPIGYNHDMGSIETYRIQKTYTLLDQTLHLVGAIGSPALGYQYVFYDAAKNEWLSYHNWGIPIVTDMNNDGIEELLLQFQGKGLNFPDIHIFAMDTEGFRVAGVNQSVTERMDIDSAFNRLSSTITDAAESIIKVEIVGEKRGSALYELEPHSLHRNS